MSIFRNKSSLFSFLTLSLLLVISGCTLIRAPANNSGFKTELSLNNLEGVYMNAGNPSGYLTKVIWSDMEFTDDFHRDVLLVEVVKNGESLTVKAINGTCSIFNKTYIYGKDFKFVEGRIVLYSDISILRDGKDPLLGPLSESITLGLDVDGNGKYSEEAMAAGIVYAVFPIAFKSMSEIRFEKFSDKPHGYQSCQKSGNSSEL